MTRLTPPIDRLNQPVDTQPPVDIQPVDADPLTQQIAAS
jgi:hypothetical protein